MDRLLEDIKKKIEAGQPLTREENLIYLTKIVGLSKEEAERIIAIDENDRKNVIID